MIYFDIKTIFSPMTIHQQSQLKSKSMKRTVPFHKIMGTMPLRHITTLHKRPLSQSSLSQSHSLSQNQSLSQCQNQSVLSQLSNRSFLNQNQSQYQKFLSNRSKRKSLNRSQSNSQM